jgi:hypothetical protein
MLHINCVPHLFSALFTAELLKSGYATDGQGRKEILELERNSIATLPFPPIGGDEAPAQTRAESHFTTFGHSIRSFVGTMGLQRTPSRH